MNHILPLVLPSEIHLYRGDDYHDSDNRALQFDEQAEEDWPDLTGATAAWSYRARKSSVVTTVTATIVNQKRITCDVSATDIPVAGYYEWDLQITLANGHKITPRRGELLIHQDATV